MHAPVRIDSHSGPSRLSCFTCRAVALIIFFPTQVVRHVFLATAPLVAFVIFGPQRDLLACWFSWLPSYPRSPKPGVPMTLSTPYTRPYTPTPPRGLPSPSKGKASPLSDHQYLSPVARIGISTTDNRRLWHEIHSPSSPASRTTTPFPVLNHSVIPILQTPIPPGGLPPPYPPPGIGAPQIPPSAHMAEKRGTHSIPQAVGVIRQSPTSSAVRITQIQTLSLPDPGILRRVSDSS